MAARGAVPLAINEADCEAFEGLFETARTRRATQQRVAEPPAGASMVAGGGGSSARGRMYGAIVSPRVVRPPFESWTRAAPYEQDLYKYGTSDKIASHYSPRASHLSMGSVGAGSSRTGHPRVAPVPQPPQPIEEPAGLPLELNEDEKKRYAQLLGEVDEDAIAPMRQEWIENVTQSLPSDLAAVAGNDPDMVDRLAAEIELEYTDSMRASVVDYVLTRPAECVRLGVPKVAPKVPRPALDTTGWRESVFAAMEQMETSLFITNPVMVEMLSTWQEYAHLSLVDILGLLTPVEAPVVGLPCHLSKFHSFQSQVCASHSWLIQAHPYD